RPGEPLEKTLATTVIADDRYIHDSIVLPDKEVAAGYKPIMPTFKDKLTEDDIFQLTAYIKSLSNAVAGETGRPKFTGTPSPEEYKSRIGFTPANMDRIRSLSEGAGGNAVNGTQPPNTPPAPTNANPAATGAPSGTAPPAGGTS